MVDVREVIDGPPDDFGVPTTDWSPWTSHPVYGWVRRPRPSRSSPVSDRQVVDVELLVPPSFPALSHRAQARLDGAEFDVIGEVERYDHSPFGWNPQWAAQSSEGGGLTWHECRSCTTTTRFGGWRRIRWRQLVAEQVQKTMAHLDSDDYGPRTSPVGDRVRGAVWTGPPRQARTARHGELLRVDVKTDTVVFPKVEAELVRVLVSGCQGCWWRQVRAGDPGTGVSWCWRLGHRPDAGAVAAAGAGVRVGRVPPRLRRR